MAYHSIRGRDPLLDTNMQAAIEKRGRELLGFGLIALGLLVAAMIGSYTPEDPSFLSATDAPVQNWLGRFGASFAAPLYMIVGRGSWLLALVPFVWGFRYVLNIGSERALSRVTFLPIVIAIAAIYASTLIPGEGWTHSFGLGGLFGDTILGAILNILPVGATFGLKVLSLIMALITLAAALFVLGFTRPELAMLRHFLTVSLIVSYDRIARLLGYSASGAIRMAGNMQENYAHSRQQRQIERREDKEWADLQHQEMQSYQPVAQSRAAQPRVTRAVAAPIIPSAPVDDHYYDPHYDEYQEPVVEERPSFLSRMPSLIKRPEPMPQPELVEQQPVANFDEMPGDDRIRAKITSVIKSRTREMPALQIDTMTPLTKGRGRGPDPLVFNPNAPRVEPRLTAAAPKPAMHRMEPPMTASLRAAAPAAAATGLTIASAVLQAPQAPTLRQAAPMPVHAPKHHEAAFDDDFDYAQEQAFAAEPAYEDDIYVEEEPLEEPVNYFARPAQVPVPEARKVVQHPVRKPTPQSTRAVAEAQPKLRFEEPAHVEYELPPLNLLSSPDKIVRHHLSDEALEENARMLESVLDDYGVKGEIVSVRPGPVVTMYELEPAPGLKASRVIGLADDIARSMSALSARVSTVPGRSVIGIELPNENREKVVLREILSARDFGDGNHKLPLALGKDIGGDPIVANLAKMPHLLIAGTTGSGKSVAINTMILSLLYKLTPEECRMIMIDPKMLELSVYDGIPHLLSPVVTDPKKAVVALKWVVGEMEERYRKMSKMGVRNIDGYNGRVADALSRGEMFSRTVQTGFDEATGDPVFETEEFAPEKMPYIVVIVDEMADLMMVAGKEIEACIQRLAQMARASGIHLIMATQRPSVDVITGTIKANFPTRISFQVTSKIDSRTILGEMGAEQLLGMGDMLYMAGGAKITRCHGPFVSDEEVEEIVNHLKSYGPPTYVNTVLEGPDEERSNDIDLVLGLGGNTDGEDALYDQAVAIVIKDRKCSTSYIQRKLAVGYNKAARLVEQMEEEGLVSAANHVGKREILVPEQ